jgi:integrase
MSWALDTEKISVNPLAAVEQPKVPKRTPEWFDMDDWRKFLAYCDAYDPDMAMYCRLSFHTTARRSELAGLRWTELRGNRLTIGRGMVIQTGAGHVVKKSTKTDTDRNIGLDATVVAQLKGWRAGRARAEFIFETDGREWTMQNTARRYKKLQAAAASTSSR